ncbi:trypsin-like serine peptidase [Haematobacter missouriensis]|nr:S1 family peptidase [Haematobacter missouriensis]
MLSGASRAGALDWPAVGRLDSGSSVCSAVLIAPDRVLTAAHCVSLADGGPFPAEKIVFRAGRALGEEVEQSVARRVVLHPDYLPRAEAGSRLASDIALVELLIPLDVQSIPLEQALLPPDDLTAIAYSRKRPEDPPQVLSCPLLRRSLGTLLIDCGVTGGASGAPLIAGPLGAGRLVGIVVARGEAGGRDIAFAVPVADALPVLESATRTP